MAREPRSAERGAATGHGSGLAEGTIAERPTLDRREGRKVFGEDPATYDAARPGHAEEVYAVLRGRWVGCGRDRMCSRSGLEPGR